MANNKVQLANGTVLIDITDTTATADDVIAGKYLHTANGEKEQGTIPVIDDDNVHASIDVLDNGIITCDINVDSGYTPGTWYSTSTAMQTVNGRTITPTKSSQVAAYRHRYTTGDIVVGPIPDSYILTTDATATETDIVSGKTAYVNGSKVTGTLEMQHCFVGSFIPTSSTGNDGDFFVKV